jgi:hypothetical protein
VLRALTVAGVMAGSLFTGLPAHAATPAPHQPVKAEWHVPNIPGIGLFLPTGGRGPVCDILGPDGKTWTEGDRRKMPKVGRWIDKSVRGGGFLLKVDVHVDCKPHDEMKAVQESLVIQTSTGFTGRGKHRHENWLNVGGYATGQGVHSARALAIGACVDRNKYRWHVVIDGVPLNPKVLPARGSFDGPAVWITCPGKAADPREAKAGVSLGVKWLKAGAVSASSIPKHSAVPCVGPGGKPRRDGADVYSYAHASRQRGKVVDDVRLVIPHVINKHLEYYTCTPN